MREIKIFIIIIFLCLVDIPYPNEGFHIQRIINLFFFEQKKLFIHSYKLSIQKEIDLRDTVPVAYLSMMLDTKESNASRT